jgi:hypothetical protein
MGLTPYIGPDVMSTSEDRSRDSSDGIETGWTARVRFPAVQDCSLLHSVHTGSGPHLASYPTGTGGSFPRSKAAGS